MGLESVGGRTATSGLIQDNSTREDGLGKKRIKKNQQISRLEGKEGRRGSRHPADSDQLLKDNH